MRAILCIYCHNLVFYFYIFLIHVLKLGVLYVESILIFLNILSNCIGNANLVYTIIRKRNVFHQLANLPTEHSAIAKALTKRGRRLVQGGGDHGEQPSMEGSIPATEAEPGTLKVTLMATPGG